LDRIAGAGTRAQIDFVGTQRGEARQLPAGFLADIILAAGIPGLSGLLGVIGLG
jgi:hypothetical protein